VFGVFRIATVIVLDRLKNFVKEGYTTNDFTIIIAIKTQEDTYGL
jgi:hypothetical protein